MCTLANMRYYEPPYDIVYVYEVDENGGGTTLDKIVEDGDEEWCGLPSFYKCACGFWCASWEDALAHLGLDRNG